MLSFKGYPADCIGFRTQASRGGSDFWPRVNGVVVAEGTPSASPCPAYVGDGVCVALTARGAASGGHSFASGVLLIGWRPSDVLGRDATKVRVRRAKVLARIPLRDFVAACANLHGADLCKANLCKANLRWADLRGADLCKADLRWANLRWADLRWADLRGADLHEADLRGANLRGANLRGADLHGANLCKADLRWANLRGANLHGADLRGAHR